jgi:ABC-2 type transport system permease protein
VALDEQPSAWQFVRLKLRLMRNGLRGKGWRIALFVLGMVGGLWAAVLGFTLFAASSFATGETRVVYATFAGAGIVLAWVFLPLLFFGVDETLDPARFALLPLRRRTLVTGMLAAAAVGVPPAVTLLATLGSVTGAAVKGGPVAALVAILGAAIGLLLCVAASRAVTSAFAGMLRSRRVRDLAALVIALLGVSCGPLQSLFWAAVSQGDSREARAVATVLQWTPLSAPYVAYVDAIDGRWALVPARLAIGLAGVLLLLFWWTRTIESAMLGSASTSGKKRVTVDGSSPVGALYPRLLRGLPKNRFGAMVAREVRYWWRHPRRRASLISLLAASIVIPFGLRVGTAGSSGGGLPVPVGMLFAGMFIGLVLANQFGNDATAYSLHLLSGVPGGVELRSRAIALTLLTAPLLAVGATGAAWLTHGLDQLPAAFGIAAAALGVSIGVSGLTSVFAPYALPDSPNPFAVNSGGATSKGLLSFVSMIVALILASPLLIAYFVLPVDLRWLVLPAGLIWGLVGGGVGTVAGGSLLDRRAPEVLDAVTPRRS